MRVRSMITIGVGFSVLVACSSTAQPEANAPASTTLTQQATAPAPGASPSPDLTTTPLPQLITPTPPSVAAPITPPEVPATTTVPSATATMPPTATAAPSPMPTATTVPLTPTPDVALGLTIPDFRVRSYGDGEITIGEVWQRGAGYTSYRISYPVDGLRLTGLLHLPDGDGPFSVIIANRGTIAREIYQPGMDSRAFSDLMARNGFLVVAPDFRGYGGGDDGPNPFYTGYYADVLGLIPQAQRLPMARPGQVGMWGHSRGASVTIAALTVTDQIAAAVAYAPAPADLTQDYERRKRNSGGNPGSATWPFTPEQNGEAYLRISPITYLDAACAGLAASRDSRYNGGRKCKRTNRGDTAHTRESCDTAFIRGQWSRVAGCCVRPIC